jgi:hypothetical protein
MDQKERTTVLVSRLRTITAPDKDFPAKEVRSILENLREMYPKYRFHYDRLYRLVVVGPPDCGLMMPPTLYWHADLVLAVHSSECAIIKDRGSIVETTGQLNRIVQTTLGLEPTGELDETTLAAMSGVVKGAPKMSNEQIEAVLKERRSRFKVRQ